MPPIKEITAFSRSNERVFDRLCWFFFFFFNFKFPTEPKDLLVTCDNVFFLSKNAFFEHRRSLKRFVYTIL